jgi:hypothetical protein
MPIVGASFLGMPAAYNVKYKIHKIKNQNNKVKAEHHQN